MGIHALIEVALAHPPLRQAFSNGRRKTPVELQQQRTGTRIKQVRMRRLMGINAQLVGGCLNAVDHGLHSVSPGAGGESVHRRLPCEQLFV